MIAVVMRTWDVLWHVEHKLVSSKAWVLVQSVLSWHNQKAAMAPA